MIRIYTIFNQLTGIIQPLSDAYLENIPIHVCKLAHKDVVCCSMAPYTMHDPTNKDIFMVYITPTLRQGANVIINQATNILLSKEHTMNEDIDFIFTCPGCGLEFDDQ